MKTIKILIIIVALLTPFSSSIASKTAKAIFASCANLPNMDINVISGQALVEVMYGSINNSVDEPVAFVVKNLTPGTIYGYKLSYLSKTFSCTAAPDLKISGEWYYIDEGGDEIVLPNGSVFQGIANPDDGGATLILNYLFRITTVDASKRNASGVPTVNIGSYLIDVDLKVEYAVL